MYKNQLDSKFTDYYLQILAKFEGEKREVATARQRSQLLKPAAVIAVNYCFLNRGRKKNQKQILKFRAAPP